MYAGNFPVYLEATFVSKNKNLYLSDKRPISLPPPFAVGVRTGRLVAQSDDATRGRRCKHPGGCWRKEDEGGKETAPRPSSQKAQDMEGVVVDEKQGSGGGGEKVPTLERPEQL